MCISVTLVIEMGISSGQKKIVGGANKFACQNTLAKTDELISDSNNDVHRHSQGWRAQ
jgi:hypothetical protein